MFAKGVFKRSWESLWERKLCLQSKGNAAKKADASGSNQLVRVYLFILVTHCSFVNLKKMQH